MAKKNHGVFLGLLLGSAAATIAYLSLSSSKKDQLLKESAKKIEDLNTYLHDKSKKVLDTVSEKVQESKDAVEVYGGIAAETVEDSLEQAKEKVEGFSETTSHIIQSKVNQLKSDKTDTEDDSEKTKS